MGCWTVEVVCVVTEIVINTVEKKKKNIPLRARDAPVSSPRPLPCFCPAAAAAASAISVASQSVEVRIVRWRHRGGHFNCQKWKVEESHDYVSYIS